ncbi:MAG: FHA domain-containing protein [Microcoleus sp. PH2017_17_BER_D_A]|nr:FHA domain-containing protein [Microcoleus sp. PH2017_17_BER_D_A]
MSVYQCPKGHESIESDYCSECGAKINGGAAVEAKSPPVRVATATINCPDCATPHEEDSGNFCEICGYNFVTGASGEIPIPKASGIACSVLDAGIIDPGATRISPTSTSPTTTGTPELLITVDRTLRCEGSPEPPAFTPMTFPMEKPSTLIGRTSDVRAIYPDLALDLDDAISHRHAVIHRQPDGALILRDIGSTNGTFLNGVELAPMTDISLKDGDEITLGHWTKMIVNITQS